MSETLRSKFYLPRLLKLILVGLTLSLALLVTSSSVSAASQKLTACSSGVLSTSTVPNFQMSYTNETFQQLTNSGLLKDLAQLKDLSCLQYLDATDKNLKGDLGNLKNLTNLEVFSLHTNPEITGDICALAGATKLRSLKLAFDPKVTGDIACLKNLTQLETFAMTYTQISGDLKVFANMPNLKALYINGTNIVGDIFSLSKLTNLEELGIADAVGNPKIVGDLSSLDNLKKLKKVSLYNIGATGCKQFTKQHPNIEQGGCAKQSQATLKNNNQISERKIGKQWNEASGGGITSSEGGSLNNPQGKQNFNRPPRGGDYTEFESQPETGLFAKFLFLLKRIFSNLPSK